MLTGKIKFFNGKLGFIIPNEPGPNVFFHATDMQEGLTSLESGQWVSYAVIPGYFYEGRTPRVMRGSVALCKKRGEHERSMDRERSKVVSIGTD